MQVETMETYSNTTNMPVIRHPGRRFPGVLVQGDSLYALCRQADEACAEMGRDARGFEAANTLRNHLWSYLVHYKQILAEHDLPLPFVET